MYDPQQPHYNQSPPVPPAYGGPEAPQQWRPMQREYLPPHQPFANTNYYPQPPTQYQAAPYRGVNKQRKDTNHTFHLLMTLFTCGMWAVFVWLPLTVWHSMGPRRKNVTRYR